MMTTMAALMETLPIAKGVGAGSESRRPLGVAVVGGLLFSQLMTLYIMPEVYTCLEPLQNWFPRRFQKPSAWTGRSRGAGADRERAQMSKVL
jgi:HAE1 family hydrophobic/amphiphilic exporter-1